MTSEQMPLSLDNLKEVCLQGELETFITEDALQPLFCYLEMLMKWNKVMNLVGPYHWSEVLSSLIIDSVYLADLLHTLPSPFSCNTEESQNAEVWDLGAGAGLPGIPLRMLWKKGNYTLVEAREKRSLFLRTVLAATPLCNTTVFSGRVESFMPTRPLADIIVSRAFMPVEKVLAMVKECSAPHGVCIFLTLAPLEQLAVLEPEWRVCAQKEYSIKNTTRWISAACRQK